jgi:lysophospholipase L1-like esterase
MSASLKGAKVVAEQRNDATGQFRTQETHPGGAIRARRLGYLAVTRYSSSALRYPATNYRCPVNSDPSQMIPVGPIPFEHGLPNFARSLIRGKPKIVAIGSSTTAGEGNIKPYPDRLLSLLQVPYPNARIAMVNDGIGGQEAPIELERFDSDVIAEKPDLVIWQIGTNAVWQRPDLKPPPPTFNETTKAIRDGLIKLRDETQADVILMDLQYLPAVLTPAKKGSAIAMVKAIGELAADANGVNVFRRFAFMEGCMRLRGSRLTGWSTREMTPDYTKATGLRIA